MPNINLLKLKFPNSARVEYKLIVDGKWITDPLNPNKVDNGVGGENSVFTMPDYQPTVWDRESQYFNFENHTKRLQLTAKSMESALSKYMIRL